MQPRAFGIFHLNLAFSAIAVEDRPAVIQRCYHPLLDLVEAGYPLGLEMTGWTLERLSELDAGWVERFGQLIRDGSCELVGSGYAQVIGPLAPAEVNRWNQTLGLDSYERLLGVRPRVVLVNEMAFSSSLIDLYASVGYEGLVMDRDNVRLALGIEHQPIGATPSTAMGPDGAQLPVLWADSILFQKLQQVAHGDIRESDYLEHVRVRIDRGEDLLPLYANDAEVFDFRPGRFEAESRLHSDGEWNRIQRQFERVVTELGAEWVAPSNALPEAQGPVSPMTGAAYPIPVKKQAKYNLARWAATGRNDVWLNSMCRRLSDHLVEGQIDDADAWRRMCALWGSDLRTHLTEPRWQQTERSVASLAEELGVDAAFGAKGGDDGAETLPEVTGIAVRPDADGIGLEVETSALRLTLNRRRGLTIQSLGFGSHGFEATIGTLAHGFFQSIALGADFYSGGVVVELADERRRITDLDWVTPQYTADGEGLTISATLECDLGPIVKSITIPASEEWIEIGYQFVGWDRPRGSVRAGTITLLPDAFGPILQYQTRNGGSEIESFQLDEPVDHATATSAFISSTAGLGATDGRIAIGDGDRMISVSWDPAACAVFPMVKHEPAHPGAFTRLYFSLLELDDTVRPGGPLGSFTMRVGSTP